MPVPLGIIWMILLVIIMSVVLNRTRIGRYTIAIGSNKEALKLSALTAEAVGKARVLEDLLSEVRCLSSTLEQARFYKERVLSAMSELRLVVDEMESHCAASCWPYPSYGDILFSVK